MPPIGGRSLITLTVPPSASLPYCTDEGPRTTSRRCTAPGLIQPRYCVAPARAVDDVVADAVDEIDDALGAEAADEGRALGRGRLLDEDAGLAAQHLRQDLMRARVDLLARGHRHGLGHVERAFLFAAGGCHGDFALDAGERHDDAQERGALRREIEIERARREEVGARVDRAAGRRQSADDEVAGAVRQPPSRRTRV